MDQQLPAHSLESHSPPLFWLLFFSFGEAKMQGKELQKDFCKHLRYPEPTIIHGHRTSSIVTQPNLPTLRRGRDTKKAPVKSFSNWIRNQKKEPRTPIELRRNAFLFIIRKKFGQ
jgi:hypothetical protein